MTRLRTAKTKPFSSHRKTLSLECLLLTLYPACLTFSPLSEAPSEILAADHLPETALAWELLCKAEMSVLPRLDGSTGFEFLLQLRCVCFGLKVGSVAMSPGMKV